MKFHQYIAAARGRPFRWGRHDCVTFAGRWIEARTGRRVAPQYASLREARQLLSEVDARATMDAAFERIGVLMAHTGDVVELPSDTDMPAFGIVAGGGRVACFVGREIGFVDMTVALSAWRVR